MRRYTAKMFDPLDHETPRMDHATLAKLARRAASLGNTSRAVEVGSWVGSTALTIAPYFERLYCVDTFEGNPHDRLGEIAKGRDVFGTFCRNTRPTFLRRIFPCVGTSRQWASVWPVPVDFVFIDASHEYEDVLADITAWRPHVRDGILCGHDYSSAFPGVQRAVGQELPEAEVVGNVWWVEI